MTKAISDKNTAAPEFYEVDITGPAVVNAAGNRPARPAPARRKIFPAGIFMILFIIESCLSAGAVISYFFYEGKSTIGEIEFYTADYLIPLAEALGNVAELNHRSRNYSRLRTLFHEKIEQRIVEEAFFVLKNGKIIAHSSVEAEKNLKGNIAGDEFAYNMDLIMKPVNQKSREVLFTDYNIVSRPAPFDRDLRLVLKQYFYPKIDTTGWMVSRAVFAGKKPVGAVCLIVSKGRIYTYLAGHIDACLRMLCAALGVSFTVSLMVTLVVLARYRSIQKNAVESTARALSSGISGAGDAFYDMTLNKAGAPAVDNEPIIVQLLEPAGEFRGGAHSANAGGATFQSGRGIKDAIPTGEGQ